MIKKIITGLLIFNSLYSASERHTTLKKKSDEIKTDTLFNAIKASSAFSVVQALHAGANVNGSKDGVSPLKRAAILHWVASELQENTKKIGYQKMFSCLLNAGADPLQKDPSDKESVIDFVQKYKARGLIDELGHFGYLKKS